MLRDNSPAVRWIGIQKASEQIPLKAEIRDELRRVAQTDPYVVFARVAKPWTATNAPRPLHWTQNDVTLPLRLKAAAVLRSAIKEEISTEVDIGELGIRRLTEAGSGHPERNTDILTAVHLLSEKSPVRSAFHGIAPRSQEERDILKAIEAEAQNERK
jgi:hypothetical protein